jgi:hypothetical protein
MNGYPQPQNPSPSGGIPPQFFTPPPAKSSAWMWIVLIIVVVAVIAVIYYSILYQPPYELTDVQPLPRVRRERTVDQETSAIGSELDAASPDIDSLDTELKDINREIGL